MNTLPEFLKARMVRPDIDKYLDTEQGNKDLAKADWDYVAALLGADGDNVDEVCKAAERITKIEGRL